MDYVPGTIRGHRDTVVTKTDTNHGLQISSLHFTGSK